MKFTKKELKEFIYQSTMEVVSRLMESRLDDERAKSAALEDIYKEMVTDEDNFQKRNPKGIDIDGKHFDNSEKIRRHFSKAQKNYIEQNQDELSNLSYASLLIDEINDIEGELRHRKKDFKLISYRPRIEKLRRRLSFLRHEYDNLIVNHQDLYAPEKIRDEKRSALNRFREQRTTREQALNDKRRNNREILQRLKDTKIENYD